MRIAAAAGDIVEFLEAKEPDISLKSWSKVQNRSE